MNFLEMGLEKGEEIQYIPSLSEENPVVATVQEEKKVLYQGEVRSLTSVTTELRDTAYQVQPGPYWTSAKGDLSDLYEATYS